MVLHYVSIFFACGADFFVVVASGKAVSLENSTVGPSFCSIKTIHFALHFMIVAVLFFHGFSIILPNFLTNRLFCPYIHMQKLQYATNRDP